jgi:DNA invertase Pin-like site-specific DNA recombinase
MDDQPQKKFVAYVRVSRQSQQISGLGLDAQRKTVQDYARQQGGIVVAEYCETETGTNKVKERPVLKCALAHARRAKAILAVAKLDRLARNVAFLSALMDAGVDFIACDQPYANRLTLHILAAMGEYEAKMISIRTTEALKMAKARGVLLGSAQPGRWDGEKNQLRLDGLAKGREQSKLVRKQKAKAAYQDLYSIVLQWRNEGKTLSQCADLLNASGHTTRTGDKWNLHGVSRILHWYNTEIEA